MQKLQFSSKKCQQFVNKAFDQSALPSLIEYIKIPNLSQNFDPEWNTNGLLQKAAEHIKQWVQSIGIKDLKCEIIKLPGLSPLIFTVVPGQIDETFFFYGHFDKQPPFQGWFQGFGPTTPIIKDDKLYGRGGADDGYSTYGTMLAIKSLQQQGIPLPRCVMITEGDEQSGSHHIQAYLKELNQRIGNPSLFFCLDSGTLDYQRLWMTTSLRGLVAGTLRVQVLTEGVHSGDSSGIIPSSFRIMRQLLDRIQDVKTGDLHQAFQVDIPSNRYKEMYDLAQLKKEGAVKQFPKVQGLDRVKENVFQSLVNRGWKAQLAVIGASGLPDCKAGNVMLPFTEVRLSIRLPPTKNAQQAKESFIKLLTSNPPYNAKITLSNVVAGSGFNAPAFSEELDGIFSEASQTYYQQRNQAISEGMSIPFLNILREMWPNGQFVVTGVLGPQSNAHGPNEFLHLPYVKKLICCIAHVIAKLTLKKVK